MKKDQRTKRLHEIMAQHGLSSADVGQILGRTAQTVRVWRSAYKNRIIPADALEVLEMKAAQFAADKANSKRG